MNELEKRKAIEALFNSGKTVKEILSCLKSTGISQATVYRTVRKLQEGKSMGRRKGSGRNLSDQTKRAQKLMKLHLARNPRQSVRKISRDLGIPKSTAHDISHKYLGLSGRKMVKRQDLDDDDRARRKTISRKLRLRFANQRHQKVLFSDEKIFLLTQPVNKQNDRIYVPTGEQKSLEESAVGRPMFPQKVMVWIGCAHNVKSKVIFFKKNETLNSDVFTFGKFWPQKWCPFVEGMD